MTSATFRRVGPALLACVAAALVLRGVWLTADPPTNPTVGVVWHDEGAWVHNARNKALFGSWRLDEWNPVYIAPVFTALEYGSFALFGVGTWQARIVSVTAGVISVLLLAGGMRRIAGPFAAVAAGALAATNYVYVMFDRAAIMEALMTACIVAAWYCSVRAEKRPEWGAGAAMMALLAYFTKAAAAFYIPALGLVALLGYVTRSRNRCAAMWTLGGLVAFAVVAAILFVLPHWQEYTFYNWQISITRKPSYDLGSLAMRTSWYPILHDLFSRMWPILFLAIAGAWGIAMRWRTATDAERLLLLWFAVGTLEMLVHDVGNERRFVFLIPVLIALASLVLGRGRLLPDEAAAVPFRNVLVAAPLLCYTLYVVWGPLIRLLFLSQVRAHSLSSAVRVSALLAVVLTGVVVAWWGRVAGWLGRIAWTATPAAALVAGLVIWDLVQFAGWARHRTYKNVEASIALGRVLAPGTLVQGKLANGLDLENRLRPLFIGHGFGNFADRKQREDVRYILTYTDPAIGYEGDQIKDVLDAYPGWHIVMTFDVAETSSGHDRAALIEKRARH